MRREYYPHKRPNGIYYVQFVDKVSGKLLSAKSTGETDLRKAELKAELWLANGIPTGKTKKLRSLEEVAEIGAILRAIRKADLTADDALKIVSAFQDMGLVNVSAVKNTGRGAVPFIQFLKTFWDYNNSPYIQDRLAHGHRFTRGYARQCQKRVAKFIKDFFGDKNLNAVTTDDLKLLSRQLAEKKLATSTIDLYISTCCTPLKWAFNEKIIPSNPAIGLTKFSIVHKERGVLTEEETAAVLAVDWKDNRAFVASLVAATTGARLGEILALRLSDIKGDTLHIAHSYSSLDGLKCPKNGHKRTTPLLPEVRAALLDLLKDNPHESDDPFIFYSMTPNKPCDYKVLVNGFYAAMDTVNKKNKEAAQKANLEQPEIAIDYKERNIVFHSWRHFFCSKITQIVDGEKVAKVSGHLSDSVFKKYADHVEEKNIKEVGDAAAQAFGSVLQFKKVGYRNGKQGNISCKSIKTGRMSKGVVDNYSKV